MINKNSKPAIVIALLFEINLIYTAISNITSGHLKTIGMVLVNIVFITIPFIIIYITNKKRLVLPHSFELASLIFILLTLYFGEYKKFYLKFWWWDSFLHGIFGCYAVIIALHLITGIITKEKEATKKRFTALIAIFAFSFSIALGTLWEMFEFLCDYFLKTNMTENGLEDTATDLLIKILFASVTSIIYYHRRLKNEKYKN
jgi:hypothetical protein